MTWLSEDIICCFAWHSLFCIAKATSHSLAQAKTTQHPWKLWRKRDGKRPGPEKWSWVRQQCCQERCGRNGRITFWRHRLHGYIWRSSWRTRCAAALPKFWSSKVLTSTGREKRWPSHLWNANQRRVKTCVRGESCVGKTVGKIACQNTI